MRWGIDFAEQERVLELAEQVKGAINLGLERLIADGTTTVLEAYNALGLGPLFRLGMTELMALRSRARKIPLELADKVKDADPVLFSTLACAREAFPAMPMFLNEDGSIVDSGASGVDISGSLQPGTRPIESLQAIKSVSSLLDKLA